MEEKFEQNTETNNQGYANQGQYNQGYANQGQYNQGYANQGQYNRGYPNQGTYNPGPDQKNNGGAGFAIAAFVLGIISAALFFAFINIPLAILAIVFGIIHLAGKKKRRGFAITGIITGIASIAGGIIFYAVLISAVFQGVMGNVGNTYNDIFNDILDEYGIYYDDGNYYDDDDNVFNLPFGYSDDDGTSL